MNEEILAELLVFSGLMATLGCITRVILAIINRRKAAVDSGNQTALSEIAHRLARLEQAVDATALEVERISEGQRFTTKLLSERGRESAASG